jgi:hypothetical protein
MRNHVHHGEHGKHGEEIRIENSVVSVCSVLKKTFLLCISVSLW